MRASIVRLSSSTPLSVPWFESIFLFFLPAQELGLMRYWLDVLHKQRSFVTGVLRAASAANFGGLVRYIHALYLL